MEPQLYV